MTTATADPVLSSRQVADLAGVSYRQLDYWTRTELVRPSAGDACGSGSRRRWTLDDVAVVRALGQLLNLGCGWPTTATAAASLRDLLAVEGSLVGLVFVDRKGRAGKGPTGTGWVIDLDPDASGAPGAPDAPAV